MRIWTQELPGSSQAVCSEREAFTSLTVDFGPFDIKGSSVSGTGPSKSSPVSTSLNCLQVPEKQLVQLLE